MKTQAKPQVPQQKRHLFDAKRINGYADTITNNNFNASYGHLLDNIGTKYAKNLSAYPNFSIIAGQLHFCRNLSGQSQLVGIRLQDGA
jgi:hypothetical protein